MQLPSVMMETTGSVQKEVSGDIIVCPLKTGTKIMRVVGNGTIYVSVTFLLPGKVPRHLLHVAQHR